MIFRNEIMEFINFICIFWLLQKKNSYTSSEYVILYEQECKKYAALSNKKANK